MNSAVMLKTLGVAAAKALSVNLKTCRAGMHAMVLVKKAHNYEIVMGLLLTWFEVRVPPIPNACHCHPQEQKH